MTPFIHRWPYWRRHREAPHYDNLFMSRYHLYVDTPITGPLYHGSTHIDKPRRAMSERDAFIAIEMRFGTARRYHLHARHGAARRSVVMKYHLSDRRH